MTHQKQVKIFNDNIRLAYWLLNHWCHHWRLHRRDYESAALEGLWHAVGRADRRQPGFAAYVRKCVIGKLRNQWKIDTGTLRLKDKILKTNHMFIVTNKPAPSFPDRSDNAGQAEKLVKRMLRCVTGRRASVLRDRMSGLSLRKCSERYGVGIERVRQIEMSAINDIRKHFGDECWAEINEDCRNSPPDVVRRLPGEPSPFFEIVVRTLEDADSFPES